MKTAKKYKTGLVIGKFYPPHSGHKYLIDEAQKQVDELTVIICARSAEIIPGKMRLKWIQEIHQQAIVILIKDDLTDMLSGTSPEEISKRWADYTINILGYVPDAVFTSEEYGARYAKYLGAEHMLVDMGRKTFPISGTAVRDDPFANWDYLEPPVREYFAKRIVVLGAESTGTTTMAKALAEHYKTTWVPEYGRIYAEGKLSSKDGNKWQSGEFTHIAEMQNKIEDELARTANKILICDTDSFATALWHERYMDFMLRDVDALSAGRRYDLYFLTDTDIPFVQDGTRDGEHIRLKMHERFVEELKKHNKPFLILSGSHKARLEKAVEACDKVLGKVKAL